jgi:sporulation protein YlmC with PRC-barrel domain
MTQQINPKSDAPLTRLRDGDLRLADQRQDVRGRAVIDQNGNTVGHVKSLFIDEAERKVRVLDIGGGGFLGMGDQHFLLPVDAITSIRDNEVHVNETADRIKHSPAYDPTLVVNYDRDYWGPYYGYYNREPYWSGAYGYPNNWYY